jgi:hypothetical protein
MQAFIDQGAWSAIGFETKISALWSAQWAEAFAKYALKENKEVGEAAQKASHDAVFRNPVVIPFWEWGSVWNPVILRAEGRDAVYLTPDAAVTGGETTETPELVTPPEPPDDGGSGTTPETQAPPATSPPSVSGTDNALLGLWTSSNGLGTLEFRADGTLIATSTTFGLSISSLYQADGTNIHLEASWFGQPFAGTCRYSVENGVLTLFIPNDNPVVYHR